MSEGEAEEMQPTNSPRFGALIIHRNHIEACGPHAWPPGKETDERFKTVDQFTAALKPYLEHSDGHNPIDILDMHGIDAEVHGDHGYLSIGFRDKADPVYAWGSRVLEGPTKSGDYQPLIAKFFSRCTEALDNKLNYRGLNREESWHFLNRRAEEEENTGNFSKAGSLYSSAGLNLESSHNHHSGKTPPKKQIAALFAKATDCQLKAGAPYSAELSLRDAKNADPGNKQLPQLEAELKKQLAEKK